MKTKIFKMILYLIIYVGKTLKYAVKIHLKWRAIGTRECISIIIWFWTVCWKQFLLMCAYSTVGTIARTYCSYKRKEKHNKRKKK